MLPNQFYFACVSVPKAKGCVSNFVKSRSCRIPPVPSWDVPEITKPQLKVTCQLRYHHCYWVSSCGQTLKPDLCWKKQFTGNNWNTLTLHFIFLLVGGKLAQCKPVHWCCINSMWFERTWQRCVGWNDCISEFLPTYTVILITCVNL